MKFEEFEEDYNYAPLTLEEFAQGAETVEDDAHLREAAIRFLAVKEEFEDALTDAGIEMG